MYISSKEEQYQRSFVWSGTQKTDDCNAQKKLHRAYEDVVGNLIANHWRRLKKTIDPILRGLPGLKVNLAFGCDHFSHCYALNHFLALLLASYIERRYSQNVLCPQTRVVGIEPTASTHVCSNTRPGDCQKELHDASFITASCKTQRNGSPVTASPMAGNPYNVIIVRHGIDWNPALFGSLPSANQRHMLPYYIGWD